MKFCFALIFVSLFSHVKTQSILSMQGQLQILQIIYLKAFNNSPTQVMSIRDCFCNTTNRPCYDNLNTPGEMTNVLSFIKSMSSFTCEPSGNYLMGKVVPTYIPYVSTDFYPPTLNSAFLAYSICGTGVGSMKAANCIQPVNISSTGPTSAQMTTLLNMVGSILTPPSLVCSRGDVQYGLLTVMQAYPLALQDLFKTTIANACFKNSMSDILTMTDFYTKVLCSQAVCSNPISFP